MKTVLIADDNAVSRELLRETLDLPGVEIVEASNGAEAVTAIGATSPCIALIDIQMPVLDGFGVIHAVRAMRPSPPTYLIALTALAMESDRLRILEAGFDAYIAKPFSVSAIRKLVADLLSESQVGAQAEN